MSVFRDILNLLTNPPGGMVYYLALLFSIWAIVGLALSRWSRGERRGIVPRLLVASALISCGRLLFFVLALVDRSTGARSSSYLVLLGPALERFLDSVSVLLICWAIVIPLQQRTFGRVFVGTTLFLVVGFYLISAVQWASTLQVDAGALYNLSWQSWIWELGQVVLLIGAGIYLLAVPVPERGTTLVMVGVLAVGHLLQAALPLPGEIPHFAAWVRFANLLAFPLFAVIAFRLVIQRFDAQSSSLQAINQESLAQITGLMNLLDTNQKMVASLELDAVLDSAIRSVSETLQSDLCAIALVEGGGSIGEIRIRYSAPSITQDQTRFNVDDYPAIQHAISRAKPVTVGPGETNGASEVYRLLESEANGPLIVQPLAYDSQVLGAMLVCRPSGSSPFTAVQVRKCETLGSHIALAVLNAQRYQQIKSHIDGQTGDLDTLGKEFSRTKADLENRLRKSKDEIAIYVQKLYETELAEQRAQNDARELRQEISRIKQSSSVSDTEIPEQLTEATAQITLLNKKVATLETARSQLEQQVQDLDKERKRLRTHLSSAEATYTTLRAHARQLQEQLANGKQQPARSMDALAVDSLPHGMVVCDREGRIVHANPAAVQRLGFQGEGWRGQDIASLWSDAAWLSAVHNVTQPPATDTAPVEPLLVARPAQGIEVALSALRAQGQYAGAVLTLHELKIDEQTRARDEYLSSIAHDLRTPMTSILGYTELLMNESVGKLEGMQRKFLQRVQANIERMGAMLNDLIGVTEIDSGQLDIDLEPVDVVRVIESALRKIQFRLEERELGTHLEVGDISPIYVDPECLQQMVDNLLTNACTSSAAGTTINVLLQQEMDETGRSYLHFAVSDTGGGIAPEDRARVFDRFYRADNALIAGLGETGVGLSIVKALVEAHHGHVWIDSRMNEGTTFHFTIPFGLEKTMRPGRHDPLVSQPRMAGDNGHG